MTKTISFGQRRDRTYTLNQIFGVVDDANCSLYQAGALYLPLLFNFFLPCRSLSKGGSSDITSLSHTTIQYGSTWQRTSKYIQFLPNPTPNPQLTPKLHYQLVPQWTLKITNSEVACSNLAQKHSQSELTRRTQCVMTWQNS